MNFLNRLVPRLVSCEYFSGVMAAAGLAVPSVQSAPGSRRRRLCPCAERNALLLVVGEYVNCGAALQLGARGGWDVDGMDDGNAMMADRMNEYLVDRLSIESHE